MTPPTRIRDVSFDPKDFRIRWFADGEPNVSVNCLDRHLATRGDKTALIFELDSSDGAARPASYRDWHDRVCRLANALRILAVANGTPISLHLPMIAAAPVVAQTCNTPGAMHVAVFRGSSP